MKFENSTYFKTLNHKLVDLPFGKFYLSDKFIISEIKPETHFGWEEVEQVIPVLVAHYGENIRVAYISNRVNSYSYNPYSWIKFEKDYGFIIASAIVNYDNLNVLNTTLEKHLSQNSIKRCFSLDEAINWVLNLKEFKKTI